MTPYETALGARFHHLMPQLRQLHGARVPEWRGQVSVTRGAGLAGLAARLAGLPSDMDMAPCMLRIEPQADGSEQWTRDFGGQGLSSVLWYDADAGDLMERMGPVLCTMEAEVRADTLHLSVRRGLLYGKWPLPGGLSPNVRGVVWQDEAGRYRFDIDLELPMLGRLLRYEGWLRPARAAEFAAL